MLAILAVSFRSQIACASLSDLTNASRRRSRSRCISSSSRPVSCSVASRLCTTDPMQLGEAGTAAAGPRFDSS